MASTTFVDGTTPVIASWLNDVNTSAYTTVPTLSTTVGNHTTQIAGKAAAGVNSDITSLASPAIGSATATTQTNGDNSTKVATTAFVSSALSAVAAPKQIQAISASVASNALTISASSLSLDFRSTTLGSGVVTTVAGTPTNLVVPSSATLGTINAQQSDIVVLALNNAGTIELAVVNIAGAVDLSETGLISTVAISASATVVNVVYSTTARTSVAYRVIGIIRSTQATAGTWATAPSLIQGQGGQALSAMSSLGYGQTWQNVAGSRAIGTTYYNTTGKPITVVVTAAASASLSGTLTINGIAVSFCQHTPSAGGGVSPLTGIVPPDGSYSASGTNFSMGTWAELR